VHLPRGAQATQLGARGRRQPGAPVRHAGDAFEGSYPRLGKYWPRPGAGHPPAPARAGPGPGGEDPPRPACGRLGVSVRNRPPAVGPCRCGVGHWSSPGPVVGWNPHGGSWASRTRHLPAAGQCAAGPCGRSWGGRCRHRTGARCHTVKDWS